MRRFRLVLATALFVLVSSCATVEGTAGSGLIGPTEAILSAATAAPRPVRGQFAMRVKAVGRRDGNVYLNSEDDYRDQRNLTITIRPPAITQLADRFGDQPDRFLIGKRVVIDGQARRVHIDFTENGRPTGKFYYQTHIDVLDADQLSVTAIE